MTTYPASPTTDRASSEMYVTTESGSVASNVSGVSWAAVFAGAAGAAALSLVLAVLGTGLGMASISPWSGEGIGAATFGVATGVWITFVALAASGVGGYLAGRLRTKWSGLHTTEVYFRDTAHGFLAWALATLLSAALLSSAVGSVASTGAKAGAAVAAGAATTAVSAVAAGAAEMADGQVGNSGTAGPMGYFMDSLFRRPASASVGTSGALVAAPDSPAPVQEVARIFASSLQTGTLSADDAQYVGQLVSQRTGLTPEEAQKRVTETFAKVKTNVEEAKTKAKEAADKARKATAYGSLWLVISLLVGAFVASLCATWGGRQRDSQLIA